MFPRCHWVDILSRIAPLFTSTDKSTCFKNRFKWWCQFILLYYYNVYMKKKCCTLWIYCLSVIKICFDGCYFYNIDGFFNSPGSCTNLICYTKYGFTYGCKRRCMFWQDGGQRAGTDRSDWQQEVPSALCVLQITAHGSGEDLPRKQSSSPTSSISIWTHPSCTQSRNEVVQ